MNTYLEENVRKGRELIQKGKALGKDTKSLEEKVKTLEAGFSKNILQSRLSELSRRNIAIKIYSEVLGCEIWLCGNEDMAAQVKQDDLEAVSYTVGEIRNLMRRNANSEDLKHVHTVKKLFNSSKIID